jgi:hypothetical protein
MKLKLANINFSEIIKYKNILGYTNIDRPFECNGFCIDCENKKLMSNETKISHGADSSDFKLLLKRNYDNDTPIMFLFRDPSPSDYEIYNEIKYPGLDIMKKVPNECYYWVKDEIKKPIISIEELISYKDMYSPYIFYLQEKYNLNNIYVTNLTKCLCLNKNNYNDVQKNCFENIFIKELLEFNPEIIICMGKETCGNLNSYIWSDEYQNISKFRDIIIKSIKHPGSINYVKGKWEEKAKKNIMQSISKQRITYGLRFVASLLRVPFG